MKEKMTFVVPGEWEQEPDEESFVHAELLCAIRRNEHSGSLCGYVAIPPAHPAYGKDCNDLNVTVHGGLTYGKHTILGSAPAVALLEKKIEEWSGTSPNFYKRILANEHKHSGKPRNYPIETSGDLWWLGFDCNHLWDYAPPTGPKMLEFERHSYDAVYRNWRYVKHETELLAEQLATMMQPPSYEDWRAARKLTASSAIRFSDFVEAAAADLSD